MHTDVDAVFSVGYFVWNRISQFLKIDLVKCTIFFVFASQYFAPHFDSSILQCFAHYVVRLRKVQIERCRG